MTRLIRLLTLVSVLTATTDAQKRFLVSPQEEIVLLKPGDAARDFVREGNSARRAQSASECNPILPLYEGNPWMVSGTWPAYHNDVMGQWYVAPATGTIDTIFFRLGSLGLGCGHDSLVYISVHRSNINQAYGPGVRPGPFYPPCQLWGYWQNTNDPDQGITAFPGSATDTSWISTYAVPGVPSTPPIGEELWGEGGFNFYAQPNSFNAVAMADLAPLQVQAGDVFFISIRLNWNQTAFHCDGEETPLEEPMYFYYSEQIVSTSDEFYPSRNWKFYEHEKGPATCAGLPLDSMKHGWYARGSGADSVDAILWDFWYSMTVTENAAPIFFSQGELGNTLDTGPRTLDALIADCYSQNPLLSGVASASIRYEVDGVEQAPVPMSEGVEEVWSGNIPGQTPGRRVTGRVEATDLEGLKSNGPSFAYTVVKFGNEWYAVDTGYACVPRDIRLTGSTIDTASFFLPSTAPGSASALDDGTSGPYDLGDYFTLFNDVYRYAWIGVNGGIALSMMATDTHHVNSNGSFLDAFMSPWTFPSPQNSGYGDTQNVGLMPPMFIAPFWADQILADDSGSYGRIVIGDAGDSCLLVVEWDSIGTVAESGPEPSATTFRVVLNWCTGAVEYQYGPGGNWSAYSQSLTGLQADSGFTSGPDVGYVLLSDDGYPAEFAPADGRCIRMFPTVGFNVTDGWNLVSIYARPLDGDYSVDHLFPGLGGFWSFRYSRGYVSTGDSVLPGRGFWVKSQSAGRIGSVAGELIHDLTVPVTDKWNLVGGPSGYMPIGSIGVTGGTVGSSYYSYNGVYYTALVLQPGEAYWVKMNGAGSLSMNSWSMPAMPQPGSVTEGTPTNTGRIVVRDAAGRSQTLYLSDGTDARGNPVDLSMYELPPLPPEEVFDVRFASGRMLETIGGAETVVRQSGTPTPDLAIAIRGARYPVTVEWDLPVSLTAATGLSIGPGGADQAAATPMAGSGTLTFDAIASGLLSIRLDGGSPVPKEFALGANYPNPFNPTTAFTVDLPVATDLRIEVVDLLGRSVAELLTGPQPAGSHRLTWNGLDRNGVAAPSGVYIIRLTSANFNASRKALLVR